MPAEDIPIAPGPTSIEFTGVTRPGARVTIKGEEISVDEDGTFHYRALFWEDHYSLELTIETDEGSKEVRRDFGPGYGE
jgi:hypothetical protein